MASESVIEHNCECEEQPLCALSSRAAQEDPIGSAAQHDRYLFVEVPLPWERKIAESAHFPAGLTDVFAKAAELGIKFRFLAFASDVHPSPDGFRRVIGYTKPSTAFARYEKIEYVVPETTVNDLIESILISPELSNRYEAYARNSADARDLFVCTHGSVDVCCGTFGYPVYKKLEEDYAAQLSGKLRVWHVSHIGGHRYAPTIVDLPEGRYWAQIEEADLDTLVYRKGQFADISCKYRGWGGGGKYEQILERELFIREGWNWISYIKKGTVLKDEGSAVQVRIDYRSAHGEVSGAYEGTVIAAGSVNVGGCGSAAKDFPQYGVTAVTKLY